MFTKITINTTINAPIEQVWEKWTHPEHIVHWNFASDDWQCPSAENDVRAGGKYHTRMEAKDGSFGFDFEAIYNEVAEKNKLTYTMTDGRQASTTFENLGKSTRVTTIFDAETENPIELQQQGWQAILNNFKHYSEVMMP